MQPGYQVQKQHPYDGTRRAGKPEGPVLTVMRVEDHCPVDGPNRKDEVVWLSDGSWCFPWNLTRVLDKVPPMDLWWTEDRPTYTHDCSKCHFLGVWVEPGKAPLDIYIHQGGMEDGTILFRYGDDPSQYESSLLAIIIQHMTRLRYQHALKRAIQAGFLDAEKVFDAIKMNLNIRE